MEYAPSNRKRLPYGMMNFADIRFDNYYYVDKTAFIPLIEQSDRFFFFIRPLFILVILFFNPSYNCLLYTSPSPRD